MGSTTLVPGSPSAMGGTPLVPGSPARSPRELSPLPNSPGARESLRRALDGTNEAPNVALAPLKWNIEQERRTRTVALRAAEDAFAAGAAVRRASHDAEQRARDRDVAQRRTSARRAGLESAPKRFDRARQAVATLRRVGRKDAAATQARKLKTMEAAYWTQVSGKAFERAAADEATELDEAFAKKQHAKTTAFRKTRTKLANAVDAGVKRTYRANPRTVDDEVWKAAHYAKHGDVDQLAYMLDLHGHAEVHRRDPDSAWTPLFFAARGGHAACVRLLCARGADPKARDPQRRCPLHLAAAFGSREACAGLIEAGADVGAVDDTDSTPPEVADARGKTAVAAFLRQFDTTRQTVEVPRLAAEPVHDGVSTALRTLAFKEHAFGKEYHGLVPTLQRLARAYVAADDLIGCRRTLERAALLCATHYGGEHALTAAAYNNMGAACHRCGEHDDACAAFAKALKVAHEARRGAAFHPAEPRDAFDSVLVPLRNLALHTLQRGDINQALPLLEHVVALLATLHDPNLRPGVPKHAPSSTEAFLAVDTTPVESVALVPALVTLAYAHLLDKNYAGCRHELDRALGILTTHEGGKAFSTTVVREHLGLLAYYEEDFDEAQRHFRDVHDILIAHGYAEDHPDVLRQVENLATATCRTGPRTWA
jgi:tetratricopeptide (TPR) repeat protein